MARVLDEDELVGSWTPVWEDVCTDTDRRGITPPFPTSMTPYGEIQLRADRCLDRTNLPTS
ncbi:hypothetical protein [Streptosporangium roseum]|uniref:hypothetical protein n=1 Tax=Streptosporangium roseum TaxID=2001 RepID=UPI00333339EF